jgi:hypothetical protein
VKASHFRMLEEAIAEARTDTRPASDIIDLQVPAPLGNSLTLPPCLH